LADWICLSGKYSNAQDIVVAAGSGPLHYQTDFYYYPSIIGYYTNGSTIYKGSVNYWSLAARCEYTLKNEDQPNGTEYLVRLHLQFNGFFITIDDYFQLDTGEQNIMSQA
jgi:hypothetical protein